jgi:hypothetical protein
MKVMFAKTRPDGKRRIGDKANSYCQIMWHSCPITVRVLLEGSEENVKKEVAYVHLGSEETNKRRKIK